MRPFAEIKSCLEVRDQDIADALAPARSLIEPGPRERTLALVSHMAKIAKPGRGAPKILLVLAHMATRDWIEGELEVKLIGDTELSVLELFVDGGFSRERILGPLRIDVPFGEFANGLGSHPHLVLPLAVQGAIEERRVVLRTSRELRRTSIPPAYSAVSASLLPMVGGTLRELPEIVTSPPPSGDPLPPEARAAETVPPEAEPRRDFKAVTLPPHLKQALAPLKKK